MELGAFCIDCNKQFSTFNSLKRHTKTDNHLDRKKALKSNLEAEYTGTAFNNTCDDSSQETDKEIEYRPTGDGITNAFVDSSQELDHSEKRHIDDDDLSEVSEDPSSQTLFRIDIDNISENSDVQPNIADEPEEESEISEQYEEIAWDDEDDELDEDDQLHNGIDYWPFESECMAELVVLCHGTHQIRRGALKYIWYLLEKRDPTVPSLQRVIDVIDKLPGYEEPKEHQYSDGIPFSSISIIHQLRQFMATPAKAHSLVRYPRKNTDNVIREIFDADHWGTNAEYHTPMVRVEGMDYYVTEFVYLKRDHSAELGRIIRFFLKIHKHTTTLMCEVRMCVLSDNKVCFDGERKYATPVKNIIKHYEGELSLETVGWLVEDNQAPQRMPDTESSSQSQESLGISAALGAPPENGPYIATPEEDMPSQEPVPPAGSALGALPPVPKKKKRKPRAKAFSHQEQVRLIHGVDQYKLKLFGRAGNPGHENTRVERRKEKYWRKVTGMLFMQFGIERMWKDVRKKWGSLKSDALKRQGELNGTGGGPYKPLTSIDKLVLDVLARVAREGVRGRDAEGALFSDDSQENEERRQQQQQLQRPVQRPVQQEPPHNQPRQQRQQQQQQRHQPQQQQQPPAPQQQQLQLPVQILPQQPQQQEQEQEPAITCSHRLSRDFELRHLRVQEEILSSRRQKLEVERARLALQREQLEVQKKMLLALEGIAASGLLNSLQQ